MGKRMHAMATLVERKTRFVMLIALPDGHAADVVADALADKVVELISDPELLQGVHERSVRITGALERINARFGLFKEIRGKGLLLGAELVDAFDGRAKDFVNAAAEHGVIMLIAGPNVLRFVPSLVIPFDVLDEGLARFEKAVEQVLDAQEATAR